MFASARHLGPSARGRPPTLAILNRALGNYNTISSVTRRTLGVVVMKVLQCCVTDEVLGVMGSVSITAANVMWSFATTDWMVYTAFPGIGLLGSLPTPIVRGVLSKQVPAHTQGAIFSCLAVLDCVCQACGSVTFNSVYTHTVAVWRGAVFMAFASSYFIATCLLVSIVYLIRIQTRAIALEKTIQAD